MVRDTEPELGLFEDALGLRIQGSSENHGIEQERLNNVFGARLLITSLGAAAGPAVEFLDYLAPATGRPTPLDTQANDLWYWHVTMMTADIAALETRLRAAGARFVSPGIVEMPEDALGLGRALLALSPTGHAILAFQPQQGARLSRAAGR